MERKAKKRVDTGTPEEADPRQPELSWQQGARQERGRQIQLIRSAQLPWGKSNDQTRVAPYMLKAVLRAINDHGIAPYMSHARISQETNINHRTVRRAVEALARLSLLSVHRARTRDGKSCNHYRIVWTELALLAPAKSAVTATYPADQVAVTADQVAVTADQVAVTADQVAVTADQVAVTADQVAVRRPANCIELKETSSTELARVPREDWAAVAEELLTIGVRSAISVVAQATSHGIRAARAHQLIARWHQLRDQHADAQTVDRERGALAWAIAHATPRQSDLTSCFPTGFVATAAARAASATRRATAAQTKVSGDRERQAAHAESAAAESRFGPTIDAADGPQRVQWLTAAGNEFFASRSRRDPDSPSVRLALIELFKRKELTECPVSQ